MERRFRVTEWLNCPDGAACLLRSIPVEWKRREQDWAEGEAELWCSPLMASSEPWKALELESFVSNWVGMASPLYSLSISHWTWDPSEGWTLGKEALQLRQIPKGIGSWRHCADHFQQLEQWVLPWHRNWEVYHQVQNVQKIPQLGSSKSRLGTEASLMLRPFYSISHNPSNWMFTFQKVVFLYCFAYKLVSSSKVVAPLGAVMILT